MLVTGDNSQGQCGPGWGNGAVVYAFLELGPNANWHGMSRTGQKDRGGGGEAAAQVGASKVHTECFQQMGALLPNG